MLSLRDKKTETVASIIKEHTTDSILRILVVGCGSGIEAAVLGGRLQAEVVGIDVVENFNPEAARHATLRKGDAMALEYEDGEFDFIYSYHALEHIDNPQLALSEMSRVLKKGGGFWIGVPNRLRLIGYVGSAGVGLKDKIAWNLVDWKARLSGKFRNEFGAHAGFSSKELSTMLAQSFPVVEDMTKSYFLSLYDRHEKLIKTIDSLGLSNIAFPSVYFYGTK